MSVYHEPPDWIAGSVESILKQTYQNLEFIIVIDAPDNQRVMDCIYSYQKKDRRIIVLINDKNRGLVYSLNRALSAASGYYIARMDADDISCPDRLKLQRNDLEARGLDLAGGQITVIDENNRVLEKRSHYPVSCRETSRALNYGSAIAHPAWFGKREVFTALKGYRDIPACEDYDFLLRARKAGFRLGNLDQICLLYRYHSGSISRTRKAEQRLCGYYLRGQYKRGRGVGEDEVKAYLLSEGAKRERERYAQYQKYSHAMLAYKAEKKYLRFLWGGMQIMATAYGRRTAWDMFFTRAACRKRR